MLLRILVVQTSLRFWVLTMLLQLWDIVLLLMLFLVSFRRVRVAAVVVPLHACDPQEGYLVHCHVELGPDLPEHGLVGVSLSSRIIMEWVVMAPEKSQPQQRRVR